MQWNSKCWHHSKKKCIVLLGSTIKSCSYQNSSCQIECYSCKIKTNSITCAIPSHESIKALSRGHACRLCGLITIFIIEKEVFKDYLSSVQGFCLRVSLEILFFFFFMLIHSHAFCDVYEYMSMVNGREHWNIIVIENNQSYLFSNNKIDKWCTSQAFWIFSLREENCVPWVFYKKRVITYSSWKTWQPAVKLDDCVCFE